MLREIRWTKKDRYCYVWNIKKKKIKQTSGHSKEETDSENKLMVNSAEREVVREKIGKKLEY